MSFLTADVTDIREGLATFSQQGLEQIACSLQALDREQIAAIPSASGMSLGALARHALFIADTSAERIAAAPEAPASGMAGRTPGQAFAEGSLSPQALREDDTADSLIAELHRAGEALAAALRSADPETLMPAPDEPWFGGRTHWLVLWYGLHQVEEFARHAGHADILRESIDGKGAYELNALADGEPWPPEGW